VRTRKLGWVYLLVLGGACRENPVRPPVEGHLDVRWSGPQGGTISGPATAGWCGLRTVLEIRSVRGDTGIALALYPGKKLDPGVYRVVDPTKAESIPPAAAVAIRWLAPNVVQGFQGDSGRVSLHRSSSGQLSGWVRARARSVVDAQRIFLTGTFQDLTMLPDTLGCAPPDTADEDAGDDDAEPADTGVH
jgi:hypothetical protein